MIRVRALSPALVLVAVLLAAGLLTGCGDDAKGTSVASPAAATTPAAPASWTVTHLLIAHRHPNLPDVTRSATEAEILAKSLMVDLATGRSFDELVLKFTDDHDSNHIPRSNNGKPGSYTWPDLKTGRKAVPEFEKAALALPVGKITPEPVKTEYGYHIIRRDK